MNYVYTKILIASIFLGCSLHLHAQEKYTTRSGIAEFEASTPSYEPVVARNKSVSAVLQLETQKFASVVFINAFEFENALMQEHFNENYLESEKYPKATFKGTLQELSPNQLNAQKTSYTLNGELTIHGKTQPIQTGVTIQKNKDETIRLQARFEIGAEEYDIKIPSVVRHKIAERISIKVDFSLEKQKER